MLSVYNLKPVIDRLVGIRYKWHARRIEYLIPPLVCESFEKAKKKQSDPGFSWDESVSP